MSTKQNLADFGTEAMGIYADEVNLGRAVPDLMDGFKPVQRRILWAASQIAKDFVKTATVVGETMGRYHPHGDSSISGAVEVMVQSNVPTITGKGNWGSLIDSAAAMRYTNMRLSEFGRTFFDPHFINKNVTQFIPNFDDATVEPVTLPAMLPNILFTAAEGIGVGTTTMLPSFTPESVVKAMGIILSGDTNPKRLARVLEFYHRHGGRIIDDKENRQEIKKLYTSTSGKVRFEAELVVDNKLRTISIDDWPPGLSPLKFIERVRQLPECASAYNHKGATGFIIECGKGYNLQQFEAFVEKVKKLTVTTRAFKLNVTRRTAQIDDGVVQMKTEYLSLSIPQILTEWLKGRLQLEKKSLAVQIANQKEAISYTKLLIHAATNLTIVFEALKQKDCRAYLAKHLKITDEQAGQILELKVRQLSALDKDNCKSQLKKQQEHLEVLKVHLSKPKAKIMADAKLALDRIKADRKFEAEKSRTLRVK